MRLIRSAVLPLAIVLAAAACSGGEKPVNPTGGSIDSRW